MPEAAPPPAAGAAAQPAPAPAASPAPPAYQQPYPQPQAYQQPYVQPQPQVYQQPYVQPQAYQPAAKSGGSSLVVGGVIIAIAALLIIIGTFAPWFSSGGPYGGVSISGWDTRDLMENSFFDWSDGKPLFSGLCSLIAGCLMAGASLFVIFVKNKGMAGLALFFSILALAMAGTNMYSILSAEMGISMGFGMILFLAGAVGGIVGGFVATTG